MSVTEATDLGSVVTIPLKFKHYAFVKIIGTGASSIVCLIKDEILNKSYAAKVVNRQTLVEDGRLQYFDRELRLLQRVYHPNIIKIIDIVYLTEVIIVVMDYCENGDLLNFLVGQGQIMPSLQRQLFFQLVSAVAFLHSKNFAHRDIKPENLFIDSQFNLKLGDFGLSRETGNNSLLSTLCGTMYYSAPEVLRKEKYDGNKADIWSLGIVLFCMNAGSLPWSETDADLIKKEICSGNVNIPQTTPKFITEIIKACTQLDPSNRPTAYELLEFQWLKPEKEHSEKSSKSKESQSLKLGFQSDHVTAGRSTSIMKTGKFLMKPMRFVNSEKQKLTDLFMHRNGEI